MRLITRFLTMTHSMASPACGSATYEVQHSVFVLEHEIENVFGNETEVYTKDEFKTVVRQFLDEHADARRRKTFLFRSDYDLAIEILQNTGNTKIADAKQRSWVRGTFALKELGTPQNPIPQLLKKRSGIPVCPYDRIYDVLSKIHINTHNHVGQKAMWDTVMLLNINGTASMPLC